GVAVGNRHHAATRLDFGVARIPAVTIDIAEKVTQRTVACHARRMAEHYLSNVNRDIGMRVNIFHQGGNLAFQARFFPLPAPITVELNVSEMGTVPFEGLHRGECCLPVTWQAERVAVNV